MPNPVETFGDTYEKLVSMTAQTNLVALDKTLDAIHSRYSWSYKMRRVGDIASKIVKAAFEVGMCLPKHLRVGE